MPHPPLRQIVASDTEWEAWRVAYLKAGAKSKRQWLRDVLNREAQLEPKAPITGERS